MALFSTLFNQIRRVVHTVIPYKSIETAEHFTSPLSLEMVHALDAWYNMYINRGPWLAADNQLQSLNLPAFVSAELAREITLESQYKFYNGGGQESDENLNPRAQFHKDEFEKLWRVLRQRLELGCAAGGMIIKPYAKNGHVYYDVIPDWSIYPVAFGDDGDLEDVIFPDGFSVGNEHYVRLERHKVENGMITITQKAFRSSSPDAIGTPIPLSEVPRWAGLQETYTTEYRGNQLFGWYKVAAANNIDVNSPMGAACFAKAANVIAQADIQYSRLLWEFEGSELAVHVDPMALKPKEGADNPNAKEAPRLNQRLFQGVDIQNGNNDLYSVFSPQIREVSLINGLNAILEKVEDLCGLSRGTIAKADHTTDARTATELRIMRQRSYATIADNQKALEHCLRDVIKATDQYADIYGLAPAGDYDVSFTWDDSILTDAAQQLNERIALQSAGVESRAGLRKWYFRESEEQAKAAIRAVDQEVADRMQMMGSIEAMLPTPGDAENPNSAAGLDTGSPSKKTEEADIV